MRTFLLVRKEDLTGISGTGEVAEGVQFSDGACALRWKTDKSSIGIYKSITDVIAIHGHNGSTTVRWT